MGGWSSKENVVLEDVNGPYIGGLNFWMCHVYGLMPQAYISLLAYPRMDYKYFRIGDIC